MKISKILKDRKFYYWLIAAVVFTAIVLIRYFKWKH